MTDNPGISIEPPAPTEDRYAAALRKLRAQAVELQGAIAHHEQAHSQAQLSLAAVQGAIQQTEMYQQEAKS